MDRGRQSDQLRRAASGLPILRQVTGLPRSPRLQCVAGMRCSPRKWRRPARITRAVLASRAIQWQTGTGKSESTERPRSRNLLSRRVTGAFPAFALAAAEFESPPVRACRPCEASGDVGRGWAAKIPTLPLYSRIFVVRQLSVYFCIISFDTAHGVVQFGSVVLKTI